MRKNKLLSRWKKDKYILLQFFAVLIFFIFLSFYSYGENTSKTVATENQRLKNIENQIETVKKEINGLEQKEHGYLASLHTIEKLLSDTQKELLEIEADLIFTENNLNELKEDCNVLQEDLNKKIISLENRLRDIYMHQRTSYLVVLLESKDFCDFLSRYKYIKDILSIDVEIINDIKEKSSSLDEKKNVLEERKEVLRLLKEEVEKEKENIAYSINAKKSIIHKIDHQKDAYIKSLEELEQSSEQIKEIIEKLHQEKLQSKKEENREIPTLKAKKGILALPLQGKIISSFGKQENSEFNTYTFNSGIDISAPMGEVIHAAGAGEVIYTGCIKGYGNIIIINHGGRMSTLYAHLFKIIISSGEQVKTGQIIGQVGDSGGASSPRLHFEVRSEGKPTDPMNWL